jgi:hypothetical protein
LKSIVIPGPLYPITVKFVSYKTLCKHGGHKNPDEILKGVFLSSQNLIYVDIKLPPAEKKHTIMHEVVHGEEYMLSGMEEESRVDTKAKWILQLMEDRTILERIEGVL